MARIQPVILSGGSGTRLWPASTPERPKQFLTLTGASTMLQQTLARVGDAALYEPPLIVSGVSHRALVAEQSAGSGARLILEPAARNTAPAIALAALAAAPDAILLVMPSDHVIADLPAFRVAIDAALPLGGQGWLCTFGIKPDRPATGYGYIEQGETLADGVHRVRRFVEKPDAVRASTFLEAGTYAWNSGIFLFRACDYLDALAAFAPLILDAARAAMADAREEGGVLFPEAQAFAASPSDSIDYAVMEKADRVAVVPVDIGWSDIGSWDALHDIAERDSSGNALLGNVRAPGSANCLIRSEGPRVTALGVEDLIVIATGDEILVMRRGSSERVKDVAKN